MREEANTVLQHPQHLHPLDDSMQWEALICRQHTSVFGLLGIA